tara:strand:- start:16 stop:441 length:426 start_codon:yes stop_codon:yes gene_type:complete
MGLDMYLTGDKFTPTHDDSVKYRILHKRALVDGYEVESQRLSLGQWRKHWALHNYIEANYEEVDGKVEFTDEELLEIADAVEQGLLVDPDDGGDMPHYQNVYAYHREPEQVAKTVKTFRDAYAWVTRDDGFWRDVTYQGSW